MMMTMIKQVDVMRLNIVKLLQIPTMVRQSFIVWQ